MLNFDPGGRTGSESIFINYLFSAVLSWTQNNPEQASRNPKISNPFQPLLAAIHWFLSYEWTCIPPPPFNKSQQRQNHSQKSPTQVLIFNSLRLESCRFKSDEKTHRPKSILQKTQYFVSKWSEILSEALLSKFVWELGSVHRVDWLSLLYSICPEHHSKALINL